MSNARAKGAPRENKHLREGHAQRNTAARSHRPRSETAQVPLLTGEEWKVTDQHNPLLTGEEWKVTDQHNPLLTGEE
jgi:hypothetical protein